MVIFGKMSMSIWNRRKTWESHRKYHQDHKNIALFPIARLKGSAGRDHDGNRCRGRNVSDLSARTGLQQCYAQERLPSANR